MTKSRLRKKGFISDYSFYSPSSREVRAGTQGKNLETGTDAEAMRSATYWCVPHMACSTCFLTPSETTCPGWHRLLWAVPSHASHSQESVLQTRLLVNLMEAVSQLRVSPSQMCPGCVRLTKTCQHRSHVACVFNAHVCCPSPDAVERERPFRTLGLAFALPVRSKQLLSWKS